MGRLRLGLLLSYWVGKTHTASVWPFRYDLWPQKSHSWRLTLFCFASQGVSLSAWQQQQFVRLFAVLLNLTWTWPLLLLLPFLFQQIINYIVLSQRVTLFLLFSQCSVCCCSRARRAINSLQSLAFLAKTDEEKLKSRWARVLMSFPSCPLLALAPLSFRE